MTILEKHPALLVNKYIDQVGRHFGSPTFWILYGLIGVFLVDQKGGKN